MTHNYICTFDDLTVPEFKRFLQATFDEASGKIPDLQKAYNKHDKVTNWISGGGVLAAAVLSGITYLLSRSEDMAFFVGFGMVPLVMFAAKIHSVSPEVHKSHQDLKEQIQIREKAKSVLDTIKSYETRYLNAPKP